MVENKDIDIDAIIDKLLEVRGYLNPQLLLNYSIDADQASKLT